MKYVSLFFTLYIVRQENLTLKQGARVYRVPGASPGILEGSGNLERGELVNQYRN